MFPCGEASGQLEQGREAGELCPAGVHGKAGAGPKVLPGTRE